MPKLDDENPPATLPEGQRSLGRAPEGQTALGSAARRPWQDARRETLIGKMILNHVQDNPSHKDRPHVTT